jgi:anti-repressor protein
MEEIIKITEHNGKRAVNARELHQFLESKYQFANWIQERITKYGFVENQDYEVFKENLKNSNGGRPQTEYALSVDMAKELSMVENNEKGRLARKYFIECEKIAREVAMASYQIEDPIKRAERWIEEQKEKKALEAKNLEMQPKAQYFDELVERSLLTGFRDTAKELGLKQSEFIKILIDRGYIYRTPKGELRPIAKYTNDLFELKDFKSISSDHAGVRTWITVKGKKVFQLLFSRKA